MISVRRILVTFTIVLLIVSNSVTALGYNPFTPGSGEGGFSGSGPGSGLSIDNADFFLTGKKTGAQLRSNIDFTDIRGHWARDYVFRMAAQSVVRGYGSSRYSPEGSVSRQEALAMLVRIMGREGEVQRRTAAGGTPPAGSGIFDLWAREYIAMAQETGIVDIGEGGNWQQSATRQEVAVWFARALRLTPVYGAEQQYLYNLRDWQGISVPNQPLVEAILREDIMRGDDRGYFNPDSGLRRSEIAVMLDKVADRFYNLRGLVARSGQVVQRGTLDGVPALGLRNTDGSYSVISLSDGTDFPVLRNGVTGLADSLQVGDWVDYVSDEEGVLYALVPQGGAADAAPAPMEGYMRSVDPASGRLYVTDYDGNVHTYRYDDSTGVTINSRPAGINDLRFGLEVTLAVRGDLVAEVEGSYYAGQPGYIPPSGRVRTGRVASIGSSSLVLDLDSGGREEFTISYGTMITKEGVSVSVGSIRAGDRAQVYTDSIASNTASRINIEGMQQLIQDVYRGILEAVHPSGGTLVLKDASVFVNGDWEDRGRRVTLELEPGAQIYYSGRAVAPGEVQSGYLNATAYVAVSSNFGNQRAVRVLLKRGSEQLYGGRIDAISWGTGEIELKDRNNIMLNNSSIILSGGRMVDISALDEDHTVTVVADRYGGINNAAVVMLEDVQLTGDGIFVGRLNEIRTREFDINYYSELDQNEWDRISSRSRNLTLEYDRDTYIIEVTGSGTKILKAEDFFQGDYADRRTSKSTRDYYAFVVADGDRARTIRITEGSVTRNGSTIENDDLEQIRVTTGEVEGLDTVLGILTINKASNWSSFYRQWERADSDNYVNYGGALILRDGRPIDARELRRGESVYVIRDDSRGIIILAQ